MKFSLYCILFSDTRTASLQVDGCSPIDLPTNQNVPVSGSGNVTLKFCVANLLPGYTLTISVAGQTNTNTDGCLELTVTQPITVEVATLSYVETDGCGRTDSYRVTLTNTRTASLQVDGCSPIDLPTNQNVPVSGSGNVTLKFCVANLLPGYTLTISVAGQTNTNTDGCLELTVTQPITVEVATLSYVETDGCGRTDSYRVTLTNTRTASLQVDGGSPIDLPTNQNVSVSGSANVALRFCVENLLPGYTLTISVAGLMETSNDGCVDLTVTQPIRAETATLSYVGCGRKDSYRVTLTTTGGVGRPSLDIVGLTVILCVGLLLGRL
ncbi:uncharacterized protein LOC101854383 [Aplysia californica]|uniref:Uncharacterized protein LOC101854383 n=1 Tax=Aplysia californica TaxID=6500 RepID=A0ABM0KAB3_APLCA|nr:uncharacterized protein LOC101854383 [Aplysia californica]